MRRIGWTLSIFILLIAPASFAQISTNASRVVCARAGHLLDVRSGQMLADQIIVIRGERIERVGPASETQIPAGAGVVDLSRATVLPGLIDAHTHIFLTGEDSVNLGTGRVTRRESFVRMPA